MLVGEGNTSINRLGGPLCDSLLFQIALPQGKETLPAWPRPIADVAWAATPEPQFAWSAAGVAGCELTGEKVPLPLKEPLR